MRAGYARAGVRACVRAYARAKKEQIVFQNNINVLVHHFAIKMCLYVSSFQPRKRLAFQPSTKEWF